MLVVGIDEAGYGPRLGPLVVGAVACEGPGADGDLWDVLADGAARVGEDAGDRVVVGDSKQIHRGGRGIGPLEEQVLALVAAVDGRAPATVGAQFARVWGGAPAIVGALLARVWAGAPDGPALPWGGDPDRSLPRVADPDRVAARGARLAAAAAAAGLRFPLLRARAVSEPEFNTAVGRTGNKAVTLFQTVAPLLDAAWDLPGASTRVAFLDKEGGRDRYLTLLGAAFPDLRVRRRVAEGPARSCYEVERRGIPWTVRVEVRGERHFPVAAASMLAKYVRELHMEGLNAFWAREVPGLRPTAGYPADADRFLAAIDGARAALGIPREAVVRCR